MTKRNLFLVLVVVFGLGAFAGFRATPAQAASCFWRCICSVPYKCCTTPTGTTCKPDPGAPIGCPQIAC